MRHSNFKFPTLTALLVGAATPALAQESTCAGLDGGVWVGGEAASSDIATAGNYLEQMAIVLGGNQYVSVFTLSEPTDVRLEAAGRGSGDPVMDLLDSNGSVILSDDDSGGDAAARAETTLQTGTYCLAVRSYDGGPMTAFVRVARQEHEALTTGIDTQGASSSSCDQAVPFGAIGTTATASANQTPFWQFTIDTSTALTITAENENADPVITLYDSNENYIADNDDFDGLNSRLDLADPLDAGTYCLEVAALSDVEAPIDVTVSTYDAEAALVAMYDRGEIAPPLDGSIAVTDLGELQSRLRQDLQVTQDVSWFSVDVAEAGLLLIEAIGGGNSDPWLVLFDDLGRQIGMNDDYGDGLDSLVTARVQRGTYIIGVRQYEGGQGLVRLLAERYIRAE